MNASLHTSNRGVTGSTRGREAREEGGCNRVAPDDGPMSVRQQHRALTSAFIHSGWFFLALFRYLARWFGWEEEFYSSHEPA